MPFENKINQGRSFNMKEFRAKLDSVLLSATHAGFWAGTTVFGTFLVTYLYANGYDASDVGLIMALMSICNVIAQPLWGYIADAKMNSAESRTRIVAPSAQVCRELFLF